LTSFDATKIRINKKVQQFYQLLKDETAPTAVTNAVTNAVTPVIPTVEAIPLIEVIPTVEVEVTQVIQLPQSSVFNLSEYEYKG
jgi:hypothetical protein